MNGIFTPLPKINLIDLFIYLWVYISNQKRDHPILKSTHTIDAFPSKNIFLETIIVVESQEMIGSWISMYESSCFRGFQICKAMVILHIIYPSIQRLNHKGFKEKNMIKCFFFILAMGSFLNWFQKHKMNVLMIIYLFGFDFQSYCMMNSCSFTNSIFAYAWIYDLDLIHIDLWFHNVNMIMSTV